MFKPKTDTHIVIKVEDIYKYLSLKEMEKLVSLIAKVENGRLEDDKKINDYLVVNCDEDYADTVFGIIAKNEFK